MKQEKTPEQRQYEQKVNEMMPKSRTGFQCIKAFISGGIICCIGQLISDVGSLMFTFTEKSRGAFTSIVLIFLGMLLTGIGVYDKIGKFSGAGSIVPITGFANSIVAPAMEYKREGYILGVGANMFKLAGPVLVYGIASSVLVGLIYCIIYALGGKA
ncbi:MAG: stage V sporulation protein AC [Clostridia bacterium]|nr:stage V sporulation protein AC [Clostridia bacterium]